MSIPKNPDISLEREFLHIPTLRMGLEPLKTLKILFDREGVWILRASEIIWVFPKIGIPQNGWFIMENPIKMDDLGYHYFRKHPFSCKNL